MKICNIVPIPHLEDLIDRKERFHLVVADMILESDKYTAFYRERIREGDHVIMDSMAFEVPQGTSLIDMAEAAKKLGPTEIVLPDDMEDAAHTIEMAIRAEQKFRFLGFRCSFMAVPHGKTLDEYLRTALVLSRIPHVNTLGIQEEVEELYSMSRYEVCARVHQATGKQLHMLGATESLSEWRDDALRRLVRSCDTAKLVVYGLAGHLVKPETKKMPKYPGRKKFGGRVGYFNYQQPVTDEDNQLRTAADNIVAWREFCEKEEAVGV